MRREHVQETLENYYSFFIDSLTLQEGGGAFNARPEQKWQF